MLATAATGKGAALPAPQVLKTPPTQSPCLKPGGGSVSEKSCVCGVGSDPLIPGLRAPCGHVCPFPHPS